MVVSCDSGIVMAPYINVNGDCIMRTNGKDRNKLF